MAKAFIPRLGNRLFAYRRTILTLFALVTLGLGWAASGLRIDASFDKTLPQSHPYMATFKQYQQQFGGANRILIALHSKSGSILTPEFLDVLKKATEETYFVPGVDRSRVTSIFTPNVRFIEIVRDGFAGGNVVSGTFKPTPEGIEEVRKNILKSGQLGRLVSADFSSAMISAELVQRDPATGEMPDVFKVAAELEKNLRGKYDGPVADVHILGFAKVMGDIADAAGGVLKFFGLAFLITAGIVMLYGRSLALTVTLLGVSVVTVVWQLGLLSLLGFGIDPLSILVPFLVFAIAISHGVQNIGTLTQEMAKGHDVKAASLAGFQRLLVPGVGALVADALGFLTITLIDVPSIRELSVAASLGMVLIIVTHLFVLPLLMSLLPLGPDYSQRMAKTYGRLDGVWRAVAVLATPKGAIPAVALAVAVFGFASIEAKHRAVGDIDAGVPELWSDSRYNKDAAFITRTFAIGVDIIQVIAQGPKNGCVDHDVVETIDRFDWHMRNVAGVRSTLSLPMAMRIVNAGWNEGNPKWRELPRDSRVLVRASAPVETSTGLLNDDCSVMPIIMFTVDHKAETIDRVTNEAEAWFKAHPSPKVTFRLATGNVGVMAATNQTVRAAETPMLLYVYGVVLVSCLVMFRGLAPSICVIIPLVLVSVLTDAIMALLGIGLKTSTLPVAALGVGIGVDYGMYMFSRLNSHLGGGRSFAEAYLQTLRETGSSILLTGLTLAAGTCTWILSGLRFQADMGLLLTFVFVANMLGAVLLSPAIAGLIDRVRPFHKVEGVVGH